MIKKILIVMMFMIFQIGTTKEDELFDYANVS